MSTFTAVVVTSMIGASCCAASGSAEAPPPPLRLSDMVQAALSNNLELAAVHLDAEAAQARLAKAGTLPNPMLSFGIMDRAEDGNWPDTAEKRIMLDQKFLGIGKRGLQREVAAREAEGASHTVYAAQLGLKRRVKETFVDLFAIRQSIAITREEEKVLLNIAGIAQSLYATGNRSQGDVFTADFIEAYIDLKVATEVDPIRLHPHPYEFFLYYDI